MTDVKNRDRLGKGRQLGGKTISGSETVTKFRVWQWKHGSFLQWSIELLVLDNNTYLKKRRNRVLSEKMFYLRQKGHYEEKVKI